MEECGHKRWMKKLILCDFDGTITTHDMGYVLLNRFSSGDWETIDQEFCDGRIGSKEAYTRVADLFGGKQEDILDFVREHAVIDPFFFAFYRDCRDAGFDVKIVSDGFGFIIETVLTLHHLQGIPFYANGCLFLKDDAKEFFFPYFNEACGRCGTCKRKLVQAHRREYDRILYIGNGLSDRCAAEEADFVFAKDALYDFCVDRNITCHHYSNFADILADIKKEIRGIIFDLDGTLVESYEAIYLGLREILERSGKKPFPFTDLRKYLQGDLEGTLAPFFSAEEIPDLIPLFRKRYEEVYLEKTVLLDGVKEVLDLLRARKIALGMASNKFGPFSRRLMSHLGIANHFRSMIGSGDVPRNKPSPDMIHAALKEMDLTPHHVVFVGDTLTDIETGRQAGVDVYALPTGFLSRKELSRGRPKRILREMKDLVRLTEEVTS